MNEITVRQEYLPERIEEVADFVVVNEEKLNAVKAAIRAARKAGSIRLEELERQQRELEVTTVLAQCRLGELTKSIERTSANQYKSATSDTRTKQIEAIGVSKQRASEYERMAAHPEVVEQVINSGEHVTRAAILRGIKEKQRIDREAKREEERQENAEKIEAMNTPLEATGMFQTIVIDPPWDWGDEGDVNQFGRAKPDYSTMPIEEIERLPVGEIADSNCHLYLWVTNRSLPKAFRLIDAWGFRYVTCLTWVKPSIGMGNYFRGSTEQVLFCVKGSQPLRRHDVGTHFEAPRGDRHSAKPDSFYELVETCSYGPYIDIFGRKDRDGWSVWGEGA